MIPKTVAYTFVTTLEEDQTFLVNTDEVTFNKVPWDVLVSKPLFENVHADEYVVLFDDINLMVWVNLTYPKSMNAQYVSTAFIDLRTYSYNVTLTEFVIHELNKLFNDKMEEMISICKGEVLV